MDCRPGPRIVAAAAVALIAIGCARGAGKAERGEVRVQVAGVRFDQDTGAHYMLLEDKSGGHSLPIVVGDEEARAIMFEMHGIRPQRPLPCELLLDVIEQTGNHVDRVVVADVRDQIYFARIYLDNGRYMIDSRPSDAIALAIGANAPIFVANKLFQTATPAHEAEPPPRTARAVGITVQELTPAMAEGFGVSPYSGVVVADTDAAARSAGLERGDIVTEADGSRVASAGDFMRIASAAAAGSRIELTVRRGTETHAIAVVIPPAANARR